MTRSHHHSKFTTRELDAMADQVSLEEDRATFMTVECGGCNQPAGQQCITAAGTPLRGPGHWQRLTKYRQENP